MTTGIYCRMCGSDSGTFTHVRDLSGRKNCLCSYCFDYIRQHNEIVEPPTNGQRSIGSNDGVTEVNTVIVAWERGKPYSGDPPPAA